MERFKNLSDLEEIKTEHGHTLLRDLMELFLLETPKRLNQIRDAILTEDYQKIARTAHILRASCAYLGAHEMAVLCENLEMIASRNSSEGMTEVKMHFYAIEKSFSDFESDMNAYLVNVDKESTNAEARF